MGLVDLSTTQPVSFIIGNCQKAKCRVCANLKRYVPLGQLSFISLPTLLYESQPLTGKGFLFRSKPRLQLKSLLN